MSLQLRCSYRVVILQEALLQKLRLGKDIYIRMKLF